MKKRRYRVRVSVDHIVLTTASSPQSAEDQALEHITTLLRDIPADHMHVTNVRQLPTEQKEPA